MEVNVPVADTISIDEVKTILPSRYSYERPLGSGASGVVIVASDQLLGREVAIKILRVENLGGAVDDNVPTRFLREAKTLAGIDHPNIVKVLASDLSTDGHPFHVMEFLDGKPLSQCINGQPLTTEFFADIFRQICAGLACAHDAGVVHRDLKPSNIFVCKENSEQKIIAKIIDFGIARVENPSAEGANLTKTNAIIGSPAYMSPEQCRSQPAGKSSDIYSLGCVMFEAMTGAPPFEAESAFELMYKHLNEKPRSLTLSARSGAATTLCEMIDRCLDKDPQKRPQSADEIAAILEKISAEHMTDELLLHDKKAASSKRLLAILIGVGTCAIAALAAGYFIQQTNLSHDQSNKTFAATTTPEKKFLDRKNKELAQLKKDFDSYKRTQDEETKKTLATRVVNNTYSLAQFLMEPPNGISIDTETAIKKLEEALPVVKHGLSAIKNQQKMNRCLAEYWNIKGDKVKAVDFATKAISAGSTDTLDAAQAYHSRALIYVSHRNFAAAARDVTSMAEIFSHHLQEDDLNQGRTLKSGIINEDWRAHQLTKIVEDVETIKPETPEEKFEAVKLTNAAIAGWLTRGRLNNDIPELLDYSKSLLQGLPADMPGVAEAKKQRDTFQSEYATFKR